MPASTLRFVNREVYFQKSITAPDIGTKTVLARDAFQFVELWLRRKKQEEALFFWTQSRSFYIASRGLTATSSPLTSYYCMLNAVKALLKVKEIEYRDYHGVSGDSISARRSLAGETSEIHRAGVLTSLSAYLMESETEKVHSLQDILGNMPFIHRAYSLTHKDKSELFIALKNPVYVRHPKRNKIWFSAEVEGLDADRRVLRYIPSGFEIDEGISDRRVIRRKKKIDWFAKKGASNLEKERAISRFQTYHRQLRLDVVSISAPTGLWYLKRRIAGITVINRYGLTLMMMAMHRLSELARYDPKGLAAHLSGSSNWLLTEFIELAPAQFIDEIACEITGLEFRMPGVRS